MLHPRFCLDEWLVKFPLTPRYAAPTYNAEIITSPLHICHNEQLRRIVKPLIDWGPEVPVDVFVWASGEPPEPYLTKIGGVPYRPADLDWPVNQYGRPLQFLAQFCFADSKDLVGDLPGDVLLAFVEDGDYEFESLHCEWQQLGIRNLVFNPYPILPL